MANSSTSNPLQFLTCKINDQPYGAWYRVLSDGRIEVLTRGRRIIIAPTTLPVEEAITVLLHSLANGEVVPDEWGFPS